MGSQSRLGSSPIASQRLGDGRESLRESLQGGGVQPQMLHPLIDHALGHGPADDVAGRQLVHESFASVVPEERSVAPQGLGEQWAGHGRVVQGGRMELHELDIGHRHSRPQGHGDAVGRRLGRIRGDREQLAGAPGGHDQVPAAKLHGIPAVIERHAPR